MIRRYLVSLAALLLLAAGPAWGQVIGGRTLSFTPQQVFNISDYGAVCNGSTNDNTAVNAAFAAAAASAAYQNNNKIAITGPANSQGCVVNSVNGTLFTLGTGSNTRPQVEIYGMTWLCTGGGNICLDLTGSKLVKVHDMSIRGDSSSIANTPEICIQVAITAQNTSSAWHMFERVSCNNSFAFTALYNFGSESNQYVGNMWVNNNVSNGPIVALGTVTGGSSYTNGNYTNVALTGGSGSGALATVVVAGAVVSTVTITYEGRDYQSGDTLSAAAASIGGTGSGFSVPVTTAAPFSVVLDGQNHWRAASAFSTITAPTDTWESLTLLTFVGDQLRNGQATFANSASMWLGWTSGARFVNSYILNSGNGSGCVQLFDNGVAKSGIIAPNIGLNLEFDCEGSYTYGIYLSGSNASQTLAQSQLRGTVLTTASAIIGTASNITAVSAPNANWTFTYPTTMQVFSSAKLWTVSGLVNVPRVTGWNWPSFQGQLTTSTISTPQQIGPLDIYSSGVGLAISCARQLSRSYTGPLCAFQRASDSTTLPINPDGFGNLDLNVFNAFCNGTTCKVQTAYDQSGNANNCTQTTAANQPTVSLQLATMNNRTAMTFGDAGALALTCTAAATINNVFASGGFAVAAVNQPSVASASDRILNKGQWNWLVLSGGTGQRLLYQFSTTAGDFNLSVSAAGSKIIDLLYNYASVSNVPIFTNNGTTSAATVSVAPVGTANTDAAANLIIGNASVTGGTTGYPGSIAEIIVFSTQPANIATSPQLEAIRRNMGTYYGLAGTVN